MLCLLIIGWITKDRLYNTIRQISKSFETVPVPETNHDHPMN